MSLHHETRKEHEAHARKHVAKAGYKAGGDIKRVVRKGIREHEDAEHGGKHEKLKLKAGGKVHGKHPSKRLDKHGREKHDLGAPVGTPPMMGNPQVRPMQASPMQPVSMAPGLPTGLRPGMEKRGGKVEHKKRARGGSTGKGEGKGKVNVIVHTGSQEALQQGMRMGAAMGARQAAGQMAPKPPMPPGAPMGGMPQQPMGGGMPPGGAPGMRPPGLKTGGKVKYPHPNAGGGGAAGRLEKNNAYGTGEKVKVKGYVRRKAGGRVKEDCE